MSRGPESVRMRQELAEALRQMGNFSTVARAMILVGMAATGEDVAPFHRDIYALLGEVLPQPLRAALTAIVEGRPTGVGRAWDGGSFSPPAPPPAPVDSDPFAVGFDF